MKILYSYSNPFRIILYSVLLSVITLSVATAQTAPTTGLRFQNTVIFGVGGGVTFPQTDYETPQTGYAISGSVEYFFKTNSIQFIGLKLNLNYNQIRGEDSRGTISSQIGPVTIPPEFSTGVFSAGLALIYGILIKRKVLPYISGGASGIWFNPTNASGQKLAGNAANLYSTNTLAYNIEGGIKIFVSDRVSINISATQYWPQTDYLDDVAAAFSNDAFTTVLAGVSFAPFYDNDPDNDGIASYRDGCPNEPEDFDGFEDEDGCPDPDNDGDAILDVADKCPNEAEDFDGFEDEDGCPDLDNDGDGILDIYDECPNEPEDLDGSADEDGCPDIDELGDEGKIILEGDEIFAPNSAMIKVEGQKYLDDVIVQLQNFPDAKWKIEGHMDSNGNKRFLRSLSLDRAKAVLEYFTYFGGLSRENFQVFGMADNFPIADNETEEGMKKNRRIVIVAVDSDGDGIPDYNDKCPEQPETFNNYEDDDGCPDKQDSVYLPDRFILQGDSIFFKDSYKIKFEAKSQLNGVIQMIKEFPNTRWRIEVHMDSFGPERDIRNLSLERAKSILEYFIFFGDLDRANFETYGMGDKFPIGDNKTEEGRVKNRRVLIIKEY